MLCRFFIVAWSACVLLLAGCCLESDSGSTPPFAALCKVGERAEPHSGVWWNAQESGRGFFLDRQGQRISVGAYVYDDAGRATWYAGLATKQDDGRYSGTLRRYSGGQTLRGAYRAPAAPTDIASMELDFSTAAKGTLTVQLTGASERQAIALEQFRGDGDGTRATFANGTWWNEAEPGRGFVIEVQADNVTLGTFAYDDAGAPIWYWSHGKLSSPTSFTLALTQMAGGQTLTGPFRQAVTLAGTVGTVSFEASGETTGILTLPDGRRIAVKRLVF